MGELKKVFRNKYIDMWVNRKFFNGYIKNRLCYGSNTWAAKENQLKRLESALIKMLRTLVSKGTKRNEDFKFVYPKQDILKMTGSTPLCE